MGLEVLVRKRARGFSPLFNSCHQPCDELIVFDFDDGLAVVRTALFTDVMRDMICATGGTLEQVLQ